MPAPSPAERAAAGRGLRADVPRSSHAELPPRQRHTDPIAMLESQAKTRVPELAPLRYGRMAASPFTFYRGGAFIMAADLGQSAGTGLRVQLCGDAHISNFGGFASPERSLIFDLNDFDETLPGPWEWDVKRLAASIAIAGRDRGFGRRARRTMVQDAVKAYRQAMRSFAGQSSLDVWYSRIDASEFEAQVRAAVNPTQLRRAVSKARAKDSARAFSKLAVNNNGKPHIRAQPPLIVPIADLLEGRDADHMIDWMRQLVSLYSETLPLDRRRLLERYEFADAARKVVGVGSVGTRAWILLMLDRSTGAPLFLQAKEAQSSVLEPFAGKSEFETEGQRVVEGQRLMQATSDIFLGWLRVPAGLDGRRRDFYVRQLWDWKASADVGRLPLAGMAAYTKVCGWTLARAHARSGDAVAIGAYLGAGDTFDRAVAAFSEAYADRSEADYAALVQEIADGRIAAQGGT